MSKATPNPLTVTVSGTFNAGTSVTFTFDQKIDLLGDELVFKNEGIKGVNPLFGTTIVDVQGESGFTSGQYDISLYAYVHSKIHSDTEGRLVTETEGN